MKRSLGLIYSFCTPLGVMNTTSSFSILFLDLIEIPPPVPVVRVDNLMN